MLNRVNPLLNRQKEYLFVYGTLRRDARGRLHRFLAGRASFVDAAAYCGKLYKIDDYPGAVPSNDPTDSIYGEVYLIRDAVTLFPVLDRYEECGPEFPEPNEYVRQQQRVSLSNGGTVNAWLYLYNHSTSGLQLIAGGFNVSLAPV